MTDSVKFCYDFYHKVYPNPTLKNLRTQIGVMLEEMGELLGEISGKDEIDEMLFKHLEKALTHASLHLKNTDGEIIISDRENFLKELCDVMVTTIVSGHHAKLDVPGAFNAINQSNASKLDENGNPVLDNNLKMVKGPNYQKPELKPFI